MNEKKKDLENSISYLKSGLYFMKFMESVPHNSFVLGSQITSFFNARQYIELQANQVRLIWPLR